MTKRAKIEKMYPDYDLDMVYSNLRYKLKKSPDGTKVLFRDGFLAVYFGQRFNASALSLGFKVAVKGRIITKIEPLSNKPFEDNEGLFRIL